MVNGGLKASIFDEAFNGFVTYNYQRKYQSREVSFCGQSGGFSRCAKGSVNS